MRVRVLNRLFFLNVTALLCSFSSAQAAVSSCLVPLKEYQSSASIDLIDENGIGIDRDLLLSRIKLDFDSSDLQPQLSNLYRAVDLPYVQYANLTYPGENDTVQFDADLGTVSQLIRTRVVLKSNPAIAYQLNFSLDSHAALARNALLRKLGYAIPSPKYYQKIKVSFSSLEERDTFLETLGGDTITSRGRWVDGGLDEIAKNNLTLTLLDGIIEPIDGKIEPDGVSIPQMHWGIFRQDQTVDTLASRRSLRALLVPLSLLDISESVNMFSFESAKIFDDAVMFSRPNAHLFKDETTIGDVLWIAKRIAKLNRADWTAIIHAGRYPPDIEALLIEKAVGRTNHLMNVLQMKNFTPMKYDEYITYGSVINGKATQENYPNYPERFTHGDPESPLRPSELTRFFGIALLNGGLGYVLEKANLYLQAITPAKYIQEHSEKSINKFIDHLMTKPNEPFVQPISVFGGPVLGGNISATRSIVTGTYYGSTSQIQLVDSISASASVGGFFGVAGLPKLGVALQPQLQGTMSYVHVRPLTDVKSAWKDNWSNILVPKFMFGLSQILAGKVDQSANEAITAFLAKLNKGEMFIITDGVSAGGAVQAQIPLGAILGLITPVASLSADISVGKQYAILSRTTIYKTDEGLHIYISRIKSSNLDTSVGASFFIKILTASNTNVKGNAHTLAYTFPEKFDTETKAKAFQRSLRQILRWNNTEMLEEEFKPYNLDHANKGHRNRLKLGPWVWSKRENFHQLTIAPPEDERYNQKEKERTIIQGEIIKISGSDFFGFFGNLLKTVAPYINIGSNAVGDDPSTNFLGKSKTFGVSTEIEITPKRPNHTYTRVQQAFTGWTISKPRFLKLMNKIASELGDNQPQGGIINPSEFAQTRTLQAYTVLWNILVYENGINRVLTLLNGNSTNTESVHDFLVALMGKKEYESYCAQRRYSTRIVRGPWLSPDEEGGLVESIGGQMTLVSCVPLWMKSVYSLRAELSHHPEVFHHEVRGVDQTKEKIRWINRIFLQLNNSLDIGQLIQWVGKDNSFFQVRVSGFRTQDENGDSKGYFSNTIGNVDPDVSAGPISEIANSSKISMHELEARYLSNGY